MWPLLVSSAGRYHELLRRRFGIDGLAQRQPDVYLLPRIHGDDKRFARFHEQAHLGEPETAIWIRPPRLVSDPPSHPAKHTRTPRPDTLTLARLSCSRSRLSASSTGQPGHVDTLSVALCESHWWREVGEAAARGGWSAVLAFTRT